MLSCGAWEERIALYAGGDLESAEAAAVEAHLRVCAGCAELARELAADRDRLAEPPAEARHVDFAAMRREIRRGIQRERQRRAVEVALAAAAVLTMMAGLVSIRRLDSTIPPPPAVAQPAIPPASLVRSAVPRPRPRLSIPSDAELKAALAAMEEPKPVPKTVEALRVPTRDRSVVILWIPENKGDNR